MTTDGKNSKVPVAYFITPKGWRALFQPQLDALAQQIRDQMEYDADGRLVPARRTS